ncbi:pentapeptide repeat-containing protein [Bacillus sp. AG4(2022)]|uniref:pentapeptide repeat-containing protein n=1 Tax=Bacillus sp. AG4(2022) TaxID=2962594 RepID=UPI002882A285|nr:pentapeptide repeat-containing protein [Bacillus sp. AG4(2022)]MDT0162454.1 pentapeptide repeat-containing protein [Bacillus sp. AG4(2022)]
MSAPLTEPNNPYKNLSSDCGSCFGLCCVALPFAKTADFAIDKSSGSPCPNLQDDFLCRTHETLRDKGFKGCTVYECFGAGQKVSQLTYAGKDWRKNPDLANEMFEVFPIMQQLHEMLLYLTEAHSLQETHSISDELQSAINTIDALTLLEAKSITNLDVYAHRSMVSELLNKSSELYRRNVHHNRTHKLISKLKRSSDFIGASLKGEDLRGASLRGALLIAGNLQNADLRKCDLLGADLRDANICGADLRGCLFLTQAQVNASIGNLSTKLPPALKIPAHWSR